MGRIYCKKALGIIMKKVNWIALIVSLAISLGAGAIARFLTADSMEQYEQMYKPPLSPPGWLFPVVWTILYILMGIAAYLVYVAETEKEQKRQALLVYGVQLLVNIGWSVIFFGFNAYLLAFAWLLLLWYLIYRIIRRFYEIDKAAGILLIPYIVWVTFAGYLNLAIAINAMM